MIHASDYDSSSDHSLEKSWESVFWILTRSMRWKGECNESQSLCGSGMQSSLKKWKQECTSGKGENCSEFEFLRATIDERKMRNEKAGKSQRDVI